MNLKNGNHVKLSIPKYQESLIGTYEPVFLTSLSVDSMKYLSKDQAIENEISATASNSGYYLGLTFIALGILSFTFYEQLKKATNIR